MKLNCGPQEGSRPGPSFGQPNSNMPSRPMMGGGNNMGPPGRSQGNGAMQMPGAGGMMAQPG